MAANDPQLVVRLEARVRDFERQMAKATKSADRSMRTIERRSATMSSKLAAAGKGAFSPLAAAATAALAPILSIAGAINGAKQAMADFDAIGKQAKAGGLDAETFQEYAYAAELGGVATDTFAKALEFFAQTSGRAAEGQGRMVTSLKELNPELLKAIQLAKTQEERFRLVADAIQQETDASRQAAIAAAAFGGAGARMVEVLRGGTAALDTTAKAARDLGIVVDRELIAKAETLNDEFSTATKILDVQFKQALIDLAPILIATAKWAGGLASEIGRIVDSMRDLENKTGAGLRESLAGLGQERLDIERQILELQDRQRSNTSVLAQAENRLTGQEIAGLQEKMALLSAEEQQILSILDARDKASTTLPRVEVGGGGDSGGGSGSRGSGSGTSRNDAAKAALREAEAVQRLIADLQAERAEIGLSNAEKRISQTLRQAGVSLTSAEGQAIAGLIHEIDAETAAIERNNEAQEQRKAALESLFGMGGDALLSIVDGSMKAEDAVKRLATQLALAAAQAALLGSGPLAGLFGDGSLFGGGGLSSTALSAIAGSPGGLFAEGGYTGNGGKNQPAGVVHGGEYVFSKAAVDKIGAGNLEAIHRNLKGYANGGLVAPTMPSINAAGGAGSISAPINVNIDARGASVEAVARLDQSLAKLRSELPATVVNSVRSARKRRIL